MPQCLTVKQYLAGKILCGFSYGILGHPVPGQGPKLVDDKTMEHILRLAAQDPVPRSVNDQNPSDPHIVHCEHCGHK